MDADGKMPDYVVLFWLISNFQRQALFGRK